MRKLNLIVVFNTNLDKALFCIRAKEPYKGLYNFVGGKVEENETNDYAKITVEPLERGFGLTLGNAVLDQEGGAFYIYDQDLYEKSYRLRKHNDLGYHVQADTLEELAEMMCIKKATISAYELGKNDVKLGILKEMAPILGTTVAYLADGESYGFSPEVMQIAMMLEEMQNEELRRVAIEQIKILAGLGNFTK